MRPWTRASDEPAWTGGIASLGNGNAARRAGGDVDGGDVDGGVSRHDAGL